MASGVDLYNAQVALLNATSTIILRSSPLPVPDRVYTTIGDAAYDCDQITVRAAVRRALALTSGVGLDAIATNRPAVNVATFNVEVVRCWPAVAAGGAPPDPATIEQFSANVTTEAWAVYTGLTQAHRDGTLLAATFCREFVVTALDPITPSGGVAGYTVTGQATIA